MISKDGRALKRLAAVTIFIACFSIVLLFLWGVICWTLTFLKISPQMYVLFLLGVCFIYFWNSFIDNTITPLIKRILK